MKIEFPKSRVCAIDFEPAAKLGIDKAVAFAHKNKINLFGGDGRDVIMASILDELLRMYEATNSKYTKVIVTHRSPADSRVKALSKSKEFKRLLRLLPVPHCQVAYWRGCPDIELAAERARTPHIKPNLALKQWVQKTQCKKPLNISDEQGSESSPGSVRESTES